MNSWDLGNTVSCSAYLLVMGSWQGCGAGAAGADTFWSEPEPEPPKRFAWSRSRSRQKRGGSGSEKGYNCGKKTAKQQEKAEQTACRNLSSITLEQVQ